MKHLDLFSGIGGFALAAQWTWKENYENVGHCEIEEFPCKIYHKQFPESKCLGDITKVEWNEKQAEIITGGFPCQPHSMAGLKKASKDERDLWGECLRAMCGIQPRWALLENVSALLTSEQGRFFNRVLADLARAGYDAEWKVIPASALGAPHPRKRIWIVAYPSKERRAWEVAPEINRCNRGSKIQWWKEDWHEVATKFCGVDDGLSHRLDKHRIAGLGNAIVPQVAFEIFKRILEVEKQFERGV
jgi:DNA (cytosine-5)-methyltransferase 1